MPELVPQVAWVTFYAILTMDYTLGETEPHLYDLATCVSAGVTNKVPAMCC